MNTEIELLDRVRDGDREAFAHLYERHAMQSLTIARDAARHDAEDVVAEVWLRIWQRPPEIRSDFGGWLRKVVVHAARRRRADRLRIGTLDRYLGDGEPGTSPTRTIARREAIDLLRDARRDGRLTETEYEAIVDALQGEATGREIAAERGVSRSAWGDRVRRAREKLRALALG